MKNEYFIVLLEDDDGDANIFEGYLGQYFALINTEFKYKRYRSAEELLTDDLNGVDILFMDIEMSGLNGLEAAKIIREANESVVIMFLTKMSALAIEGYSVNAVDYIVKPISYSVFVRKINKAIKSIVYDDEFNKLKGYMVKTQDGVVILNPTEIRYVEVYSHNLVYHLTEGRTLTSRGAIASAEKTLSKCNFVRCNKSFLINLNYLTKISGNDAILDGDVISIGRAFRQSLISALNGFLR